MGKQAVLVLYVLALIAVVVGVDILFFKQHFWERLAVNIGIVLVFGAFYLRFLKRPLAQPPLCEPGTAFAWPAHPVAADKVPVPWRAEA